jgi:hypothetical protein
MLSRRRFNGHIVLVAAVAILLWITTHRSPVPSKLRTNRYRWSSSTSSMYTGVPELNFDGMGDIPLLNSDSSVQLIPASPNTADNLVSIPNPYAIEEHDESDVPSYSKPTLNSLAELYPDSPPLIQLIMVWHDHGDNVHPQYLPNFLASVAANPIIDLLMIRYDRYRIGHGCTDSIASHIPNIREICYGLDDFWNEHANFLCEKWRCIDEERKEIFNILMQRRDSDSVITMTCNVNLY